MRILFYIFLVLPALCFSQSSTDCPTWGKKNNVSKADYFKSLSKGKAKSTVMVKPQQQTSGSETKPEEQKKNVQSKPQSNFYTTKRYNLFPEENKKVAVKKQPIVNKPVAETKEALAENKKSETKEAEANNSAPVVNEELAVGEIAKASGAAAEKKAVVHKKTKQISGKEKKRNAVKKTPRIGKRKIDRCSNKF